MPVVAATGKRVSVNMLSAESARGDLRFMLHDGPVNGDVFLEFLKRLMIGAKASVWLIVDGHSLHRVRKITACVESIEGRLCLFYLPACAPQLHPDEVVWINEKRDVSGR